MTATHDAAHGELQVDGRKVDPKNVGYLIGETPFETGTSRPI